MAARIVDPSRFLLLGALIDWSEWYALQGPGAPTPDTIARKQRGLGSPRTLHLRWVTAPGLGCPTEPFRVWRRPAAPPSPESVIAYSEASLWPLPERTIAFARPYALVQARITSPTGLTGTLKAFAGVPDASWACGAQTLVAGTRDYSFCAPVIQSLVLPAQASLVQLTGQDQATQGDPNWAQVEVVGLPVDPTDPKWQAQGGMIQPQGLVGALGAPRKAARARFLRGAPFYGWGPQLEPGIAAPPWTLADPDALLKSLDQDLLGLLRETLAGWPPGKQAAHQVTRSLAPAGGGQPAQAQLAPLATLLLGVGSDPLVSLICGWGTAFEETNLPPLQLGSTTLYNDPEHSDWDYMVTARWERGLDGRSKPLELAALALAPPRAARPPAPVGLKPAADGLQAPEKTDQDWRAVVRVAWDRPQSIRPFEVASYAFARAGVAPVAGAKALLSPRPGDSALAPIGATSSAPGDPQGRLTALDDGYALAAVPSPNLLRYALAHQSLFGLWSAWSAAPLAIEEPPPRKVDILSARLDPQPGGARLTLEYAWDWRARSPERFELRGRLYAQAKLGEAPADLSLPAGLQLVLGGGAGAPLKIQHGGLAKAVPSLAGAAVDYLSPDGLSLVALPPESAGPRRYRLSIPGLQLDFDAAPRVGLALWARAVECRAPQRVGPWGSAPTLTSLADPRAPLLQVSQDKVALASMPDAAGRHHLCLTWKPVAGAQHYFVYETTEEKLRADHGLASAPRSLTLEARLAALRAILAAQPARRSFVRVNAAPVAAPLLPLTIPRGSKEIHLYVPLALSAGGVESPWPGGGPGGDQGRWAIAYAAPQVAIPSAPDLEVSRVLDHSANPPAYRARIRARTKPGAPVARLEIYRVRVPAAAAELDTMGPPVAVLSGSGGGYVVEPTVSTEPGVSQAIGTVTGLDPVPGSWRPVLYRALAWGEDDPERGRYGGRSVPSALRELIVPPAEPPDLAGPTVSEPGPQPGDLLVEALTLAPVAETPLGPHRLRAEVYSVAADGHTQSLFAYPGADDSDRLDRLSAAAPPPGAAGLWRSPGPGPGQTRLALRVSRGPAAPGLKVRLLLTDPLGRAAEAALEVLPGSPLAVQHLS